VSVEELHPADRFAQGLEKCARVRHVAVVHIAEDAQVPVVLAGVAGQLELSRSKLVFECVCHWSPVLYREKQNAHLLG
jgi:hypothetical protein